MSNTNSNAAEIVDNAKLARMKNDLAAYREAENEARRALARAVESTAIIKSKYEMLLAECEARAVARRKKGEIIVNPGY